MDTATGSTGGAARPEGTDLALVLGEVDGLTESEGDVHPIGTANGAGIPVEGEGGLGIAVTIADRPGLTVDEQVIGPIPNEVAYQIAAFRWISRRCTSCRVRSTMSSPVTLASGAFAAVIPTARTRPESRSRTMCRL